MKSIDFVSKSVELSLKKEFGEDISIMLRKLHKPNTYFNVQVRFNMGSFFLYAPSYYIYDTNLLIPDFLNIHKKLFDSLSEFLSNGFIDPNFLTEQCARRFDFDREDSEFCDMYAIECICSELHDSHNTPLESILALSSIENFIQFHDNYS